jgi:hypothetical protein
MEIKAINRKAHNSLSLFVEPDGRRCRKCKRCLAAKVKRQRYVFAVASWKDTEFRMMASGNRRWKEGANGHLGARGWLRHRGIYDRKLNKFAPGACFLDAAKSYHWFECRKVMEDRS